jgi:hypothetical protein
MEPDKYDPEEWLRLYVQWVNGQLDSPPATEVLASSVTYLLSTEQRQMPAVVTVDISATPDDSAERKGPEAEKSAGSTSCYIRGDALPADGDFWGIYVLACRSFRCKIFGKPMHAQCLRSMQDNFRCPECRDRMEQVYELREMEKWQAKNCAFCTETCNGEEEKRIPVCCVNEACIAALNICCKECATDNSWPTCRMCEARSLEEAWRGVEELQKRPFAILKAEGTSTSWKPGAGVPQGAGNHALCWAAATATVLNCFGASKSLEECVHLFAISEKATEEWDEYKKEYYQAETSATATDFATVSEKMKESESGKEIFKQAQHRFGVPVFPAEVNTVWSNAAAKINSIIAAIDQNKLVMAGIDIHWIVIYGYKWYDTGVTFKAYDPQTGETADDYICREEEIDDLYIVG